MQPESKKFTAMVGGKPVTIETGKLAGQAGGAVTVQLGDSIVFASATMKAEPNAEQDFFPLTVEYEERMYAGGKIPGSFFRREGRPSTEAILTARLVDRPIRPLFSSDIRNEVQVILFTLSADPDNPLDILAINAASAALMISDIPWAGPVGAVRIGRVNGEFVVNPTYAQLDASDLDLRMAGTRDAILMVECGSDEIKEADMLKALEFGHKAMQPMIDIQEELAAQCAKTKREVQLFPINVALVSQTSQRGAVEMETLLDAPHNKAEMNSRIDALKEQIVAELAGGDAAKINPLKAAFEEVYRQVVRQRILIDGKRPDGRQTKEIRPIWCEVGISPRAHGSGLFTRGETQVVTLATLGTPKEAQELDTLSPTDTKRYIHHYNFPPYATGEVKMLRAIPPRNRAWRSGRTGVAAGHSFGKGIPVYPAPGF